MTNTNAAPDVRLDHIDKDEAEALAFMVAGSDYTSEQFENDWAEFIELKKRKKTS